MPVYRNEILAGSQSQKNNANIIEKSLKLDNAAGGATGLTRNLSGANRKTFTVSFWYKQTIPDIAKVFFSGKKDGAGYPNFAFTYEAANRPRIWDYSGAAFNSNVYYSNRHRDLGWNHHHFIADTTESTSTDRIRYYLNGQRITDTDSGPFPSLNSLLYIAWASDDAVICGPAAGSGQAVDGYVAHFYYLDGTAESVDEFGRIDSNGIWTPKLYTLNNYGTHGCFLKFDNPSNIGEDSSGNGNDWADSAFSSTDIVDEHPGNPFCIINRDSSHAEPGTITNGGLSYTLSATTLSHHGSLGAEQGKWYWEVYITDDDWQYLGISADNYTTRDRYVPDQGIGMNYLGDIYYNTTTIGPTDTTNQGPTYAVGDVLQIALDVDNQMVWWGKNGQWYTANGTTSSTINTANVENALGGYDFSTFGISDDPYLRASDAWLPFIGNSSTGAGSGIFNFGQDSTFNGTLAASSNTDTSGFGSFKYTPPSGFRALCARNLGIYQPYNPKDHIRVIKYDGNSTSGRKITGLGFQPDLVWIKQSDQTGFHYLFDSVRGDGTHFKFGDGILDGSLLDTNTLQSFDADGFTLGAQGTVNGSGNTYIALCMNAGSNNQISDTTGDLTMTVTKSPAGFFAISESPLGSNTINKKIGHGLGAEPEFMLIKRVNNGSARWQAWHRSHSPPEDDPKNWYDGIMGTSSLAETGPSNTHIRAITSDTVHIGGDTTDVLNRLMLYSFRSVPGLCKVTFYLGNGSNSGPFVYCGFRPSWVMIKKKDSTDNWHIYSEVNDTYDTDTPQMLFMNLDTPLSSSAGYSISLTHNGFKLNTGFDGLNTNNSWYHVLAFSSEALGSTALRNAAIGRRAVDDF